MKKSLKAAWLATLAVALVACASTAVQVASLRESSVNSADSAPDAKTYAGKKPGQFVLIERGFTGQPPLVPHSVEGYDIGTAENACLECHIDDEFKGRKMPKMSASHFTKTAGGGAPAVLNNLKWQCDNCHVPQVAAQPLVGNDFRSK